MPPTSTFARTADSPYGAAPQMNPLGEMVRKRLADLKAKGVTQTMVADRAGKAGAQSLLSQVAIGLKRFMVEDLEGWANGLEFVGEERETFLRLGKEASYFLVPSETMSGESAIGLRLWRELIALRAELFANRSQLLRGQSQLAEANARVLALEEKLELLIQRRKSGSKRGDTQA